MASYDITVPSNANWRRTFIYRLPADGADASDGETVDLTGSTIRMMARQRDAAEATVLFSISSVGGIAGGGGGIAITDAPAGTFDVQIAVLGERWAGVAGVYDLILTKADGSSERLMNGTLLVSRGVTR